MTDKTDPIAHAARLLREAAEEYKSGISVAGVPDWEGEPETKAAYDEHMAAAAALDAMHSGFDAADMATASAQGFRDGVASVAASAGSEPVAWLDDGRQVSGGAGELVYRVATTRSKTSMPSATAAAFHIPLYTHPSPPEGAGWRPIAEAPRDGTSLLLTRKQCGSIADGFWRTDSATSSGSWIWAYVRKEPTHFKLRPAPPTSSADSRKGE